ncbi:hypothetical protein [Streptomyces sp. NPDC058644]|uniref:hypothetical protein n=1 Tax=unclassified Streptomyces TaxID=2593676 RepID=UPI0036564CA4
MYPTLFTTPGVKAFAEDIDAERQRQIAKFGEQHHPDGTADDFTARTMRDSARMICEARAARGALTWVDVLDEEYWEARAETDPAKLRTELVQVAAVCAAWIADIDSRTAPPETYPSAITVFCDQCGTEVTGDYLVTDAMTKDERLEVARAHLRNTARWSCTPAGDFCPKDAEAQQT